VARIGRLISSLSPTIFKSSAHARRRYVPSGVVVGIVTVAVPLDVLVCCLRSSTASGRTCWSAISGRPTKTAIALILHLRKPVDPDAIVAAVASLAPFGAGNQPPRPHRRGRDDRHRL
jgi:hypothetical protein